MKTTTSAALIAELVRRHLVGEAIALHHLVGGRRCIAEIYATATGFVFADVGWDTNDSSHPFHRVDGQATAGAGGDVIIALGDRRGMTAPGHLSRQKSHRVKPFQQARNP